MAHHPTSGQQRGGKPGTTTQTLQVSLVGSASITEGGTGTYSIILDSGTLKSGENITFSLSTTYASASSDDISAFTINGGTLTYNQNGSYTFTASTDISGGTTLGSVSLTATDDSNYEGNETFSVSITPLQTTQSNTTIKTGTTSVSVTIIDNDVAPPPPPASDPDFKQGIDGLLAQKWTSAKTADQSDTDSNLTVTYSFPNAYTDYGKAYSEASSKKFQALNLNEATAFTTTVDLVSSYVSGLTFVPIPLGASNDANADIRVAKTVTTGADAWAYFPGTGKGGDIWFDRDGGDYGGIGGMDWNAYQPGDYTYTVFLHEFGHALGLKHSFETSYLGPVPSELDSLEYTVMSYDAYVDPSDPNVNSRNWWADDGNNPQTFMMLDIAALQTMYGADYGTNSGNTTYKWNSNGGISLNGGTSYNDLNSNTDVIFMTVWDGGGIDTYDFSNFNFDISIDLRPGHWITLDYTDTSNPSQRADLLQGDGTHWATGNIANALVIAGVNTGTSGSGAGYIENAIGGSGHDILIGNAVNNELTGGLGNDIFQFTSLDGSIDTIADFGVGNDQIDFSMLGVSYSDITYGQENGYTFIYVNTDSDANAELTVRLVGNLTLDQSDFLFV